MNIYQPSGQLCFFSIIILLPAMYAALVRMLPPFANLHTWRPSVETATTQNHFSPTCTIDSMPSVYLSSVDRFICVLVFIHVGLVASHSSISTMMIILDSTFHLLFVCFLYPPIYFSVETNNIVSVCVSLLYFVIEWKTICSAWH